MKSKGTFYGTIAVVLVIGYLATQIYLRNEEAKRVAQETLDSIIPSVAVVRPKAADPMTNVTLPGNIEAWFQAPIYAQVSGYVTDWYKDYGAEVKKGDVLAKIDAPTISARFEQANADLKAQKAKYEIADLTAQRYTAMRKSNAIPIQSISVKEANAQVEQAKLHAAEQHVKNFAALMNFRTIVAPYDGILISRRINVGDYVNKEGDLGDSGKGSELFTVADTHKMRLFVSIPERFGPFLKNDLTADVVVPQYPERHYTAHFLTLAKGFQIDTRTVITEFTIDNDDQSLWPGSYATVSLSVKTNEKSLIIPSTALVFDDKGTQVAVVDSNQKAHFKPIKINKIMDSEISVETGLSESDMIIDNPSSALLEGDTVQVVTPEAGIASN